MDFSINQKLWLECNGGAVVTGATSLSWNRLVHGSSLMDVWTGVPVLHNLQFGDIYITHYHFDDDAFMLKADDAYNVWKPTAERALIDAMVFMEQSYDEGVVIEALQNYIRKNTDDFSELRKVAAHYNVSDEVVNYWLNEAMEESDMSMG